MTLSENPVSRPGCRQYICRGDVCGKLQMLTSSYNIWLVLISFLVAMLASYTALDMAGRITASNGWLARWWLAGGAGGVGSGIWSMHFIGMLAYHVPIAMGYDPWITALSWLLAIFSSAFALSLVTQKEL